MSDVERIAAIRRGTRKTERREKRYRAELLRVRDLLDDIADHIDELLERN